MQNTIVEPEVIVRGSAEHKDYLEHQHGAIKEWVNSVETRLAISSRVLLLFYVVYITVRASVASALPANDWVKYILLGVDGLMLAVQSMGLEGSRPGLIHLAQEMEENGKGREARKLMGSANMVQWLMGATAVDIVLQSILVQNKTFLGFDLTPLIDGYSYALLIARVVAVGMYLGQMAKLSHRGPKIISAHEAAKQADEVEQRQIRIDNANILGVVEQGIGTWAKPMVEQVKLVLENQMRQLVDQQATEISRLKAELEATKMSSGSTFYLAEIGRQFEELTQQMTQQIGACVSTSVNASLPDVDALTQYLMRQIDAKVDATKNASAINVDAVTQMIQRQIDAKVDALRPASPAPRQSVPHQPRKTTLTSPAGQSGDSDKIVAINGMTKAAFFAAFDENPALLALSSYKIAEEFRDKNASEATARRAKAEYLEAHPEKRDLAV